MLVETVHDGQFLIKSTLGHFSRKQIVVAAELNLLSGSVVAIDATDGDLVKAFDNAIAAVDEVAGILFNNVNTTAATGTGVDTKGVIVEMGVGDHIVNGELLLWKAGVDAGEQATAIATMKAAGIHLANV
jgi:hypothetical protein